MDNHHQNQRHQTYQQQHNQHQNQNHNQHPQHQQQNHQQQQRHPCHLPTLLRQNCHHQHGIQNEDCVQEELTEKKCYAELLCPREAMRFYRDPMRKGRKDGASGGSGGSCSTLVERFAFPENEMKLPDVIEKSDRVHCRKIVHELAKCLSRHKVGARSS